MVLQHNMVSLFTNRQLGITTGVKGKSTEKLSSGYRINKASDDAAGLSISEKMRSQIRGLTRASDNCEDGISLIQTADGALSEDHAMVHRLRELFVQASNDAVYEPEDQQKIQNEIDEIVKEIDRVADDTEFNKKKLLDGTYGGDEIQIAPQPLFYTLDGDDISPTEIEDMDGLKLIYAEITDDFAATQVQTGMETMPGYDSLKNILQTQIVPQAVRALTNAFPTAFGYLSSSTIGIGLKLYDDSSSSTMASVTTSYWTDGSGNIYKDNQTYKLSVNMGYLSFDDNGDLVTDENNLYGRSALETTIVHEMMHAFMDESVTNGMVGATLGVTNSSNAFPKWYKEGMAQAACGGASYYNDWVRKSLGLNSSSTEDQIRASLGNSSNKLYNSTSGTSNYGTGYLASMYLASKVNGGSDVSQASLRSGMDTMLKEIREGKSLADIVSEHTSYSSISDFENSFGVDDDSVGFVKNLLSAIGNGGGSIVAGYGSKDILPDSSYSTNLFKLDTAVDTVLNVYPADVVRYTDGGKGAAGSPSGGGVAYGGQIPVADPKPYVPDSHGEWLQVGANAGQGIRIKIADMHAVEMGLDNLSAMGHIDANVGIQKCDIAINYISKERSKLGAYQNRLEYTIKIDDLSAENLQDAESRIRDTDMADEMTRYAKENILEQAGISMLSTANNSSQQVLQLLG